MAANFWESSHCKTWLLRDRKSVFRAVNQKDVTGGLFPRRQDVFALRLYFVEYIQKLGKLLKLKQRVMATAIVFFKRFYLKASFVDFDPRLIAPTALFLAAKSEECSLNARKFVETIHAWTKEKWLYTVEDMMECEFFVLEFLSFDLIVFHPYRPVIQFLSDVGRTECLPTAWQIVNDSYRTDLCLLYPPYLIAIAAVYMACTFSEQSVSEWLTKLNVKLEEVLDITKTMLELYDDYERKTNAATASAATAATATPTNGTAAASNSAATAASPAAGGTASASSSVAMSDTKQSAAPKPANGADATVASSSSAAAASAYPNLSANSPYATPPEELLKRLDAHYREKRKLIQAAAATQAAATAAAQAAAAAAATAAAASAALANAKNAHYHHRYNQAAAAAAAAGGGGTEMAAPLQHHQPLYPLIVGASGTPQITNQLAAYQQQLALLQQMEQQQQLAIQQQQQQQQQQQSQQPYVINYALPPPQQPRQ